MQIVDRSLPDPNDPLGLTFAQRAHSDLNELMQAPPVDWPTPAAESRPIEWSDVVQMYEALTPPAYKKVAE